MSNHDPADTVTTGHVVTATLPEGEVKTPKAVRARATRASSAAHRPVSVAAIVELPVSATVTRWPDSPAGDPEISCMGVEPGSGALALGPVEAAAPALLGSPVNAGLVDRHLPVTGFSVLASAIPPDERELEAILNGMIPVEYASGCAPEEPGRAPVVAKPTRSLRLPELERPTFALRPETRRLPTTASASSWVRSQPAVSPAPDPLIVEPNRRMAWRRTP